MNIALNRINCDKTLSALDKAFGERLITASSTCEQYGSDESYHPPMPPDAVVRQLITCYRTV